MQIWIFSVGSQLFRTKTIDNSLNPQFNEYFEAIVDQSSIQKLRINLFDEDTTRQDEELGRLSVPLAYVRKERVVAKVRISIFCVLFLDWK